MKVSEAIDQLEIEDTVWVKLEVYKIDYSEFPLGASGESASVCWFNGEQEISLTEPTPLNALAQEYDVEPDTIREWLDKGHKGSFEKEAPRYQYPIKTMPALIADITYRKNLAKVALDKVDKEMYTTPIMRLAQQKYEIYSNVVKLLNDLEPVEQAEKVEVPELVAEKMKYYKSALQMLSSEYFDSSLEIDSDELANWIDQNSEKFFRAWLDGYTVKPKRWVVKFKQQNEQFYFIGWMNSYSTLPAGYGDKEADNVIKFTDKSKAEAVATLVEGSVEEV